MAHSRIASETVPFLIFWSRHFTVSTVQVNKPSTHYDGSRHTYDILILFVELLYAAVIGS